MSGKDDLMRVPFRTKLVVLLCIVVCAPLLTACGTSASSLPDPEPAPPWFHMGVVAGSNLRYGQPFVVSLGARAARLEFDVATPAAEMEDAIDLYARAGIEPLLLAGFHGRLPTSAEARNLATWAARFGPRGTFWADKGYPARVAVETIEFGNETSYRDQFADTRAESAWWALPSYAERARTYARRFAEAHAAVSETASGVGLLAIGEAGADRDEWMRWMFAEVPDLGSRVAGWTVHPYGPRWQTRMDDVIATARSLGAPDSVPLHVTEWGLATDDGRCLDDNYGWDACMTYEEAARTAHAAIGGMRARYDRRLAAIYVYHAHDLRPSGATSDREAYFGVLRSDGEPKGAYAEQVRAQLAAAP